MPFPKKITTLALAGLFCSTTPCMSQDGVVSDTEMEASGDAQTLPAVTRGSQLMGLDVIAAIDGTHLGKLEDVVLSPDGKLAVGLVRLVSQAHAEGGEGLEASALSGVPMSALTLRLAAVEDEAAADDDGLQDHREDRMLIETARDDGEREQEFVCRSGMLLESAPTLASLDLLDTTWLSDVQAHYGLTWTAAVDASSGKDHVLLGRLVGAEVVGNDQAELGRIADLALDVEAMTVRYAALETGGLFGVGESLHAVQIQPATLDAENRSITVDVDEESVEALPELPHDAPWPKEPVAISSNPEDGVDRG